MRTPKNLRIGAAIAVVAGLMLIGGSVLVRANVLEENNLSAHPGVLIAALVCITLPALLLIATLTWPTRNQGMELTTESLIEHVKQILKDQPQVDSDRVTKDDVNRSIHDKVQELELLLVPPSLGQKEKIEYLLKFQTEHKRVVESIDRKGNVFKREIDSADPELTKLLLELIQFEPVSTEDNEKSTI